MIASLAASTLAFFAAGYFARRWLDDNELPKGATRGALIFSIALAAAYGAGWIVEHLV